MLDLHKYLTNPFNDSRISMSELLAFSNDHLARLIANNPAAVFAARIAATTTALNGVGGTQMTECFPAGRTVFTHCADGDLAEELQTLVNGVTDYAAALGAPVVTAATALLTSWNAIYQTSETSTGAKSTTENAKGVARLALQLELYKNLLTLALNFPDQPDELDVYMQQNLLWPHTPSTSTPAPTPTPTATPKPAGP